jgi:hypothetical protein
MEMKIDECREAVVVVGCGWRKFKVSGMRNS